MLAQVGVALGGIELKVHYELNLYRFGASGVLVNGRQDTGAALLAQVEAGEEVVITRRGVAIARIVAEPARPADGFDLQELFQFTDAQPMHEGPDAVNFMAELRRDVRY